MVALIINQEKVTREWLEAQISNLRGDIATIPSYHIDITEAFGERIIETIQRGPLALSERASECLAEAFTPWTYITPPIGHMGPSFRFNVQGDRSVRIEMLSAHGEALWTGTLLPAWKGNEDV